MRRLTILVFGLTVIFGLVACGGDDDSSADSSADDAASSGLAPAEDGGDAATSGLVDDGESGGGDGGVAPDSCSLLTLDDVVEAGLAAVSGPVPTEGARFGECTFADASGQMILQLQVFAPDEAGGTYFDEVEVDGIGEAAKYSAGFRVLVVDVSDGSQIVLFTPPDTGPEDPESVLTALARIAAG